MSATPATICLHVVLAGDGHGHLACVGCGEARPIESWAKASPPPGATAAPLRARVVWSGSKPGGVHALKLHIVGVEQPDGALDALGEVDEVLVMPAPPRSRR